MKHPIIKLLPFSIFFYLEDILKFSSASLSIVSKQEILNVSTHLANITIIAFWKYTVKPVLMTTFLKQPPVLNDHVVVLP